MDSCVIKSRSVFVVVVDLRRRRSVWVLNRKIGEKNESRSFIKPEGWGLPGGRNEDGETVIETGENEVFEETGLEIKLDESSLRLEPENHGDYEVIVYITLDFQGEIRRRSSKEIKQAQWFPINRPPKNAYKSHLRRHWSAMNLLKSRGALR